MKTSCSLASRASCPAEGSCSAPVRIRRSGCSRRSAAGASSIGETMAVLKPAASSAALSGTAVSRSDMVRRTWEDMGVRGED